MRKTRIITIVGAALAFAAGAVSAQTPANDPSARLKEVLPASVADHVLATIADARAHQLPAQALEQRALKFAAKGVKPADIARAIDAQEIRMSAARDSIGRSRGRSANGDEIEAGAEALRQGVNGSDVSNLAKSAPSGRSLAVPLFVIGSLVDRGLPSDSALARVLDRLNARASDSDLQQLPAQASAGQSHRPTGVGEGKPATAGRPTGVRGGKPASAGPPAGVPANAGIRGKSAGKGKH